MTIQRIAVHVKPRAKRSCLVWSEESGWTAALRAPPVDGAANAELIELVAAHFGCRRSDVRVVIGQTSRRKVLEVDAPD